MKTPILNRATAALSAVGFSALAGLTACTQQTPSTYRPAPAEQAVGLVEEQNVDKTVIDNKTRTKTVEEDVAVPFKRTEEYVETVKKPKTVNFQVPVKKTKTVMESVPVTKNVTTVTKRPVDMLLVVDNSSSMEPSQQKLRNALRGFATSYLKPSNDIRIGVITTDTYLANPAFTEFLGRTVRKSSYKYNDIHPVVGRSYAKLLPGIHDGPIDTMCIPLMGDFFNGPSRCSVRNDKNHNPGPDHCINPAQGESSLTECVNTVNNDSVHSGNPIISTLNGNPEQIYRDFMVNVSVGTSGSGSERGLDSVAQFLADNESDPATRLFRKDSLKVILFLSDEDDQSMIVPENPGSGFSPDTGYTSKCPTLKADGFAYTLSTCIADENSLVPVETYKQKLDAFFQALDGTTANYFVAPIVTSNGQTVARLQALQRKMQSYGGKHQSPTDQDLGRRYIKLAELVGNGSNVYDIGASDYGPILQAMFKKLVTPVTEMVQQPKTVEYTVNEDRTRTEYEDVQEKRTRQVDDVRHEKRQKQVEEAYQEPRIVHEIKRNVTDVIQLKREPLTPTSVAVRVIHADGSADPVSPTQYKVEGKTLTITDSGLLQQMKASDKVDVMIQPKSVTQ